MQVRRVRSLGGEDPLEKEDQPTPVFSPGKSQDRGAWRLRSPGSPESGMTERTQRIHI